MPRVTARPLRDILMDVTLRNKPVTKGLAEEAARAVAADGVITQGEVDALEAFGDGPRDASRLRLEGSASWKQGTEAGRALFNGLANAVESLYDGGNFEARRAAPAPAFNPFGWWMGGWATPSTSRASDQPVAVTGAELLRQMREGSEGWLRGDFVELLKQYPRATSFRNSEANVPKRAVEQAYRKIKTDWLQGKVTNEADLLADLKPLLDARYR